MINVCVYSLSVDVGSASTFTMFTAGKWGCSPVQCSGLLYGYKYILTQA